MVKGALDGSFKKQQNKSIKCLHTAPVVSSKYPEALTVTVCSSPVSAPLCLLANWPTLHTCDSPGCIVACSCLCFSARLFLCYAWLSSGFPGLITCCRPCLSPTCLPRLCPGQPSVFDHEFRLFPPGYTPARLCGYTAHHWTCLPAR